MRIPLVTAIGALVLSLALARASSAQVYPDGPWDGYRNGALPPTGATGNLYGPPPTPSYPGYAPMPNPGPPGPAGNYSYGAPGPASHYGGYGGHANHPPYSPAPSSMPGAPTYMPASDPAPSPQPQAANPEDSYGQPSNPAPSGAAAGDAPQLFDTNIEFDTGADDYAVRQTKETQWLVAADALFMTRVRGNSYALLKVPSATPPPPMTFETVALDVADFDFDYELGWRVSAGRMVCDGWGMEVAFFAMADGWDYDQTFTGILELQGPGWQLGSDPDLANPTDTSFRVQNMSEFYSGEINLTRGICDWATLRIGARWIEFNDRLEVDELYIPLYNLLISTTDNNLIGPQIGADFKLFEWGSCAHGAATSCDSDTECTDGTSGKWAGLHGLFARGGGCRFRINSTFNCAVLYNWIEHDPYSPYIGPPLTSVANEVAILGEVGLTAKYRLTDHVAVRAGYQFMLLHGVALAPDQIATSDVVTETTSTKLGSLITHGGTFGVEVFW